MKRTDEKTRIEDALLIRSIDDFCKEKLISPVAFFSRTITEISQFLNLKNRTKITQIKKLYLMSDPYLLDKVRTKELSINKAASYSFKTNRLNSENFEQQTIKRINALLAEYSVENEKKIRDELIFYLKMILTLYEFELVNHWSIDSIFSAINLKALSNNTGDLLKKIAARFDNRIQNIKDEKDRPILLFVRLDSGFSNNIEKLEGISERLSEPKDKENTDYLLTFKRDPPIVKEASFDIE